MIKVGDRVTLFNNMSREGIVVDMKRQKSDQWIVGATMEHIFILSIHFQPPHGPVENHRADHVMRLE